MKKQLFILLGFSLLSASAFAQNIDSLISRYVAATGGVELYQQIEKYSVHQVGNEANVPYESSMAVAFKDNKVLRNRTVLSRSFLYQLDGANANLYVPTGGLNRVSTFQSQKMSDFEKSKLTAELKDKYLPILDYKAKGYRAKLIGNKVIDKMEVVQVEFSRADITRNYYFSPKTNLIVQEDITYSNGEKISYQHSKYDKLESGLMYPSESIMTEAGKTRKISTELKINDVPDDEFAIK